MLKESSESKTFTIADQLEFARLSGDHNPMHMDEIAARRTPAGAPIVHGMHAVIWALDLMAQNYPALEIRSANVRFARFIYLNSPVELRLVQRTRTVVRFELTTLGQVAVFVALDLKRASPKSAEPGVAFDAPEISTTAESPNEPTFEELSGLSGRLVRTMSDGLELRFPHLAKVITAKRLGGLAQLSKLVGMISPGLHSIFASFNVDFVEDPATTSELRFSVADTDPRFRLVRMDVAGSGLVGKVTAFSRWPPIDSPPPLADLAAHVKSSEFSAGVALVLGGSRGLGAVTAKILALGGAKTIITYARGEEDARRLAREINTACGPESCNTLRVDVRKDVRVQLASLASAVTHFYYFATPPILSQNEGVFSPDLYAIFSRFYLSGFFEALQFLVPQARNGILSAFYPSSAYVETRPSGMTEYSMAKMAGELLCADLNRSYRRHLRIHVERLPRVLTDQTASLTPTETADPVATMLPVIRSVYSAGQN
jgi:acyl dehydratase/NAD(P)-dependent dehydrogenase (short-subunit alcohol dehydrogenase family)